MKKILFIAPEPPPYAGPEVACRDLRNSLQERARLEIVPVRSNIRADNKRKGKLDFEGVKNALRILFRVFRTARANPQAGAYMLLSSNRVGFARDALMVLLLKAAGCNAVAGHYQGGFFAEFYMRAGWMMKHLVRVVLRNLELVIVQGDALKRQFSGLVHDRKIVVIPNGMKDPGRDTVKRRAERQTLCVAFLGHLHIAKGYPDLVAAVGTARDEGCDIELHAAGERIGRAAQDRAMRQFMSPSRWKRGRCLLNSLALGLDGEATSSWVKLRGVLQNGDKWEFLEQADLLALPSYTESCPISIMEAMVCGLPILATRVGAIPDLVDEGRGGFLVEPGDEAGLTDGLLKLAADRKMRHEMGQWNRKKILTHFSSDKVTGQFESLFLELGNRS